MGGYDDWVAQRSAQPSPVAATSAASETRSESKSAPARPRTARVSSRLTNWEAKELESLPDQIADVESQQQALTAELSDPALYQEAPERAGQINDELATLEHKLEELFERWEALEAKRAES